METYNIHGNYSHAMTTSTLLIFCLLLLFGQTTESEVEQKIC